MRQEDGFAGPILHFRGCDTQGLRLAAITIRPRDAMAPGPVRIRGGEIAPMLLAQVADLSIWRHDFTLAVGEAGYHLDGRDHPVATRLDGNIRIAFVSCNGEENGDLDRDQAERNLMWARLADDHARDPFALLLQGGDQIYADEATHGHPLSEAWPDHVPADPSPADLDSLTRHLERRFAERYMMVLAAEGCADLFASVPSLSVWDDHDICDGWGSLPESRTSSAVGQALFRVARRMYLLFQHGATDKDVPALFMDPTGHNLGWRRDLPGVTLFAPDLRSERHRHRVMGDAGWKAVESLRPTGDHVFMVSSVPLLGPRLSLMESLMMVIPRMQHYEDDLRDQWQSHAHRDEWRRMLGQVLRMRKAAPVTVLSGEIHLATRAEMGPDATRVHQLVASGISHRAPPKAYARALGLFAGLGDAPLQGHPIRIKPLPGQRHRYVAERNFLTLDRRDGRWQAVWHLEDSGPTPPLALD
ncbi:alkaline phosphatase D family protein [Paracoccus sp. WLY502]|uniref:alkaline phosphatase D family protein n=1 Tax=Paracoccus yibinensis TaxID=3068891 RepID=UPI002796B549|nr:alkaline phosphatase D family protein [Paracoccus sp. WLY502]MDQ1899485.1 alkaline phosphatase D family protein [Paracoccus sp. WLY502]